MDIGLRDRFIKLWGKHFPGAGLPVTFQYADEPAVLPLPAAQGWSCVLAQILRAFLGETVCLEDASIGCSGGKRYLGFSQALRPGFEHFLSCGIPGKLEGERYKKSPELVLELMRRQPEFHAPAKRIVFKRWDKLVEGDDPAAVVFFATPDVLAGLFTLAGFEESDPEAVIAPFSAGCGSIARYPFLTQKPVVGMFDVSARPYVPAGTLSFAVPFAKFARMVEDMPESFLVTESWTKVRKRLPCAQRAEKL